MTNPRTVTLVLVAFLLACPLAARPAHASGEAAQGQAPGKLPTDGEVRHAMSEIRDLVAAAMPAIREGRFGDADFRRLADGITDRLQEVTAHNRLPADIQARLNAILSPLGQAARNLKTEGDRALSAVTAALDEYGRAVDHSGWQNAKEKKQ